MCVSEIVIAPLDEEVFELDDDEFEHVDRVGEGRGDAAVFSPPLLLLSMRLFAVHALSCSYRN